MIPTRRMLDQVQRTSGPLDAPCISTQPSPVTEHPCHDQFLHPPSGDHKTVKDAKADQQAYERMEAEIMDVPESDAECRARDAKDAEAMVALHAKHQTHRCGEIVAAAVDRSSRGDVDKLVQHVQELHSDNTGGVVSALAEDMASVGPLLARVRALPFEHVTIGMKKITTKGFTFPQISEQKKVLFVTCPPAPADKERRAAHGKQKLALSRKLFRPRSGRTPESGLLAQERHDVVVVIVTCGHASEHLNLFWSVDGVCYLHKKDDEWRRTHLGGQLRCVTRDTKHSHNFVRGGKTVIGAGEARDKPIMRGGFVENPLPRRDGFFQTPFGPPRPPYRGLSTRQIANEDVRAFRDKTARENTKRKRDIEDANRSGVTLFQSERDDGQPWREYEPTPAKKMCEDDPDPWEHPQPGTDYFDNDDDGKGSRITEIPLPLVPYPRTLSLTEAKAALERHRKNRFRGRGQAVDYETLPVQVMVLRNDE